MTEEVAVVALVSTREGKRDQLLALWPALSEQVRAENGCLTYDLHAVMGADDRFLVLERWASLDALAAHAATPHMTQFMAAGADLFSAAPEVLVLSAVPSS